MTKDPGWILEHKRDTYSQAGEDGVIEAILSVLSTRDRWCVEFGAWDGVLLSNTRNLIEHDGYSAVLIEASKSKFAELRETYSSASNVVLVNAFVGFSETDNLDAILASSVIPRDFDFLSIDIDGNDYHVWKAVTKYRPKVVCIEFNPTIPNEVRFVQPANPAVTQGASISSLVDLGKEKGYELVSVLVCNALFVDARYYPLFEISNNRPEALRKDTSAVTYVFSGFDGSVFLHGSRRFPWHDLPMNESTVQHLPKFLRKYPPDYGLAEKIAFELYIGLTSPRRLLRRIRQRLTGREVR